LFKATLLINANSGIACGWSESYYREGVSQVTAEAKAKELMSYRRGALCEQFDIAGVRVTKITAGEPNLSAVLPPPDPKKGVFTGPADYPNTAALYRMLGGIHSNSRDHRGFPDAFFEAPSATGKMVLTGGGQSALTTWINHLVANAWGWLRYPGPGDPAPENFSVVNLTADAGTGYIKANGTVPAGWLTTARPLLLSGFQGELGSTLNGLWSTKSSSSNTGYVLLKATAPTGVLSAYPPGTAKVSRPDFIFQPFTSGSYIRVSSRKTGRPFDLLRGRRSKSR